MNSDFFRKYRELILICVLMLAFVIFQICANIFFDSDIQVLIIKAEVAVSAVVLVIMSMMVVITSDTYISVMRGRDTAGMVMITLILILVSGIGMAVDQTGAFIMMATCTVGVMIATFIGGPKMCAVVAFCSSLMFAIPLGFTWKMAAYALWLYVMAAICAFICRKGCDKRKCLTAYTVVLIMRSVFLAVVCMMGNIDYRSAVAGIITTAVILTITVFLYIRTESLREYKVEFVKNKHDLELASKIQMSAVPHDFPSSRTLESYGMMEPAIDVGGDFYDYFSIKQNLVAIVIGDVSDKGLPAALFMMKAKGVIRAIAMVEHEPNRIMVLANKELCRDNVVEQFVTLWIGVLDTDTGILRYSNAGHTPPYISRSGGKFEKLENPKGLIIGVSDLYRYKVSEIQMYEGDTLFVYTDGVNEAFNENNEEYGHGRLCRILDRSVELHPKELVEAVRADISSFTASTPMSDDITMFCVRTYRTSYSEITVKALNENLSEITGFLEETLLSSGCPEKTVMKMEIVAEEIFVNICTYGYRNVEPDDVVMLCRYCDGEVKMVFYNKGEMFDPVSRDELIVDEDVNNWKIGGFGIHMIKKLVDHANYKYLGGRNILTLWKKSE